MKRSTFLVAGLMVMAGLPAHAAVLIQVDQSTQRMHVSVDGVPTFDWRVSTGRPGNDTPNGKFRPNRLDADHHSDEYDGAPMPYAIFFDLKGHAIHGTYEKIGRPGASHGCVRLQPGNAQKLFHLVEAAGLAQVSVQIGGDVKVALAGSSPRKRVVAQQRPRAIDDSQLYDLPIPGPYPPMLDQPDGYRSRYQGW